MGYSSRRVKNNPEDYTEIIRADTATMDLEGKAVFFSLVSEDRASAENLARIALAKTRGGKEPEDRGSLQSCGSGAATPMDWKARYRAKGEYSQP